MIRGCEDKEEKYSQRFLSEACYEIWCSPCIEDHLQCSRDSRRLLRVPWTGRISNQSILKEITPEYLLEGLMLELQYFDHPMWRANLLEKTLMLGKIEGKRRRVQKRMRWLDSIIDSMDMSLRNFGRWWRTKKPGCCSPWGCKELDTIEWTIAKHRWPLLTKLSAP